MIRNTMSVRWSKWIVPICASLICWSFAASAAVEDSLEAWWAMDRIVTEDGVRKVKDQSGKGRDLACSDDLTIARKGTRTGLYFPGGDKTWSTFTTPAGMQNRTISFWMYHCPETGDHYYKSQGGFMPSLFESINGWKILLSCNTSTRQNGTTLNAVYAPNVVVAEAGQLKCGGNLVHTGVWRHHAMMLELQDLGGGNWKVRSIYYVNGRFVCATDWFDRKGFQNYFSSQTAWLGNQSHSPLGDESATGNRPLHAYLDEVRLFSRVLTAEEVFDEFERSRNSSRSCLADWPVDGDIGSVVADVSGNGKNLQLGADTEIVSPQAAGCPNGHGAVLLKPSNQADGNGESSAYAYAANMPLPREFTFSFWVKQIPGGNINPNLFRPDSPAGFYLIGGKDGGDIYMHDTWTTMVRTDEGWIPKMITDRWMHYLSTVRYVFNPATSNLEMRIVAYVNGRRIVASSTDEYMVVEGMDLSKGGLNLAESAAAKLCVGCEGNSSSGKRSLNGYLSGIKVLDYPVSDSEAADFYRNELAQAGLVVTSRDRVGLRLAGDVAERGAWRVVSAPAGAEAAESLGSAEGETIFSLPVCGDYVFANVEHPWCVRKVRRVASDAANEAPVVSVSASAATVDGTAAAIVTATVTDDGKLDACRGHWTKVSGPGGVWFGDVTAPSTTARFGAVGDYVLRYTADDGQATGTGDVSVSVASAETESVDLANGLIAEWGVNGPLLTESVNKEKTLTTNDRSKVTPSGAFGYALENTSVEMSLNDARTGVSVNPGYTTTGYSNCLLEETVEINDVKHLKDDYRTVSLWMFHDQTVPGADNVKFAILVGQQYSFQLTYNPLDGADTFRIYSQGNGGTACSVDFAKPSFSTRGKWVHVCYVMNRQDGSAADNAVWVNGVKLTRTAAQGANVPRIGTGTLTLGGMSSLAIDWGNRNHMNSYLYKSGTSLADAEWYSRSFPGKVDEVKVWNRKLTDAEIRRLSLSPDLDAVAPASVEVNAPEGMYARTLTTLDAKAFLDPLAKGPASLKCEWAVLSGDASRITFSDKNVLKPSITAKAGSYVLQLTVVSPEGQVKSLPIQVDVLPIGAVIIVR